MVRIPVGNKIIKMKQYYNASTLFQHLKTLSFHNLFLLSK